ncbi:MAG: nicotinate-nucleotide diphosphorylase (carboxylating), partial [Actinobacteria bacterium]|nr:nicotinate-nucleotide diphosphorylase (carboxylating) [Actinomycetota bacterium]
MLTKELINQVVGAALREDAPNGDVTSEHLIPADATAVAELAAREPGVF